MSALVSAIVDSTQKVIGEVTGAGTQTYSEPRMIEDVGRAFNIIFKKRFWDHLCKWTNVTLDGVTGKITTDAFTNVIDFDDFRYVVIGGTQRKLLHMPSGINPSSLSQVTTPQYFGSLHVSDADYLGRKINVYPISATGTIDVYARFHPKAQDAAWAGTDRINLDQDLMVYATAFIALAGDALNADARDTAQQMMETRYKTIVTSLGDHEIPLRSPGDIPREWGVV